MIDFVLSFLGLKPSGFKRQSKFLNVLGRFSDAGKGGRHSSKYLSFFLMSLTLLFSDMLKLSYVESIREAISSRFIVVKKTIHNLLEFPTTISEYMSIKNENNKLRREIDDLKIKITTMKSIETEYAKLKESVNLNYSIENYKVIEKVLGFDKTIFESFLIISSTNDISKKGGVVISSDGLVGLIYQKSDRTAIVMTILDQKLFIPVKTESGEHLIVSGDGKQCLISKEIMEKDGRIDPVIHVGDILYTSGEGGVFQANLPVAKVLRIDENKNVIAEPISRIGDVSFVWVLEPFL